MIIDEDRMTKMENTNASMLTVLAAMQEQLKKIEAGIYGDDKNKYIGIIERQELQQDQINKLTLKVLEIEAVNDRQEIAIKAKKSVLNIVFEAIKWVALGYCVLKGIVDAGSIFEIFKK